MILTVDERLTLLRVLPKERNVADMRILRDLRMNLSFTEEEREKWGIITNHETLMMHWEEDGEAEIPIGEIATSIIVDELRKLDKQDKITEKILVIFERFIPATE